MYNTSKCLSMWGQMIDARTWPRGDRGFAKAVALPPQMQKPVSNIQPFRFVFFHFFQSALLLFLSAKEKVVHVPF